ncbi:MAG: UbiH/UbiF/VisC/COQ6 family ubiquinone biosynthesis hydroxylase [Alphaproteobacteria bacterium]|nr:UbiH/UbiF/VisC/COQ6 family ubiquinone biosynthesis hydroxylase [Alphaproteobacteria bacterium]
MHDQDAAQKKNILKTKVAIIGGGQSGLTLASILGRNNVPTICVDRDPPALHISENFDLRTTAISYGSAQVLKAAGVWDTLLAEACAIKDIDILDSDSPVLLKFLIDDVQKDAFGWIINNRDMRIALQQKITTHDQTAHIAPDQATDFTAHNDYIEITLASGTIIHADILVGADGRTSFVRKHANIPTRKWPYNQRAIICTVAHERPHNHVAIEHFKAEGPFAVLPMSDDADGTHRSSLVWTEDYDGSVYAKENSLMALSDDAFNAELNKRFPDTYGAVHMVNERRAFPLGLEHAVDYIAPRLCLIADAAHGIHPIAGQGLNLGMRDIAALAEILVDAHENDQDLGAQDLLEKYQRKRRFDNMAMAAVTDALVKVFGVSFPPFRAARQMGLKAVDRINPIKKFFMKQAMGTSGLLPHMIKEDEK